ncbi:MAG: molybdopterin-dependent oxidoreductase [Myxococcota bacterium]
MSEQERVAYMTCPLCEATCGLEVTVRGSEVLRIRGDREDVFSAGYICPKGASLGQLHHDPDRLRGPHIRRGSRHVEVSWDEAFEEVERGMGRVIERYGRDAVAVYLGNPNVHNLAGTFYVRPVLAALRTRNLYSAATVDQMPRHVSVGLMFGSPVAIPVPDLDRTQYLLLLGANPFESNGSLCTAPDWPGRLRRLRERGGKLVVVDPRRTRTAKAADEHLFIRPGTDTYLLLAMAHVLFEEKLVRPGKLAEHLVGLDALREAVRPFDPETVSYRTTIPAETVRRLAREFAAADAAAAYGRIGTHTTEFGTLASWATDVLNVLTGNLDRPGGSLFPLAAHARPPRGLPGRGFSVGRWRSRVRDLPEVRGELPAATLAAEIDTPGEGQVRALLTIAGNPVLSTPNGARLDSALSQLEFMVSVDPYLNETTRHADVILPPPSPLERSHYPVALYGVATRHVANWSPAVFSSKGPSEAKILARLALVFAGRGASTDPTTLEDQILRGQIEHEIGSPGSRIEGRNPEEILGALGDRPGPDRLLDLLIRTGPYGDAFGAEPGGLSIDRLEERPHGIDLGPLEPRIPDVLRTPSGKIELLPPLLAEDLERLKLHLREDRNDGALRLIGRRLVRSNNSWMHNVPKLVRGRELCTLLIHPDDAERLGIESGSRARVSSRVGTVEVPVELTDEILAGVVSLPHGFGHDHEGTRLSVASTRPGVNSNLLTDEAPLDPLSGNGVLNGIPVTVEPVLA